MGFNLSCLGDLGTCTGEWEIWSVSGRVCIDGYDCPMLWSTFYGLVGFFFCWSQQRKNVQV